MLQSRSVRVYGGGAIGGVAEDASREAVCGVVGGAARGCGSTRRAHATCWLRFEQAYGTDGWLVSGIDKVPLEIAVISGSGMLQPRSVGVYYGKAVDDVAKGHSS